jgi:hypothetical protein
MNKKKNWIFTKLYNDGKKEVVKVPVGDFDKNYAKNFADKIFKEEDSCIVVYAYYVKRILISKRFYLMDMDKNFCFNRNGLEF